jgi:ATP-binding cassette subfamily B protein
MLRWAAGANNRGHVSPQDARWRWPGLWQRRPNDCGPCCLSLVARYHGLCCDIGLARRLTGWRWWSGTSLLGLAQAANRIGLTSLCARVTTDTLLNLSSPCVAHLRPNHFVVVRGAEPQTVHVSDPLRGQKRIPIEAFTSRWDGIVLLLQPVATVAPNGGNELSVPSVR